MVTLNTDEPPMFGATLEGEYLAVATALDLRAVDLAQLAGTVVTASFLNAASGSRLLAEIDSVVRGRLPECRVSDI
ncbi:adenosine/AMP deaminase-like protein [Actinokineospora auranticolor]|uniref:Adenosine/AMP deaminase-like protein n=1 Tax=Actinokineospora auranticolor TaxID=155976 RepID=A0A2S6GLS0_9PSEU|nr:adenosine/AMP deaminase-like protein [Actinokineospora auranticolor]